ncbi:MAG: hypothetical protein IPM53_19595 [Anaerolineaceae bacterium]|nr:hypothetical protein [Anaerolineaceae bacterium]
MEDLINFVAEKSNLPRRLAQAATNATLDYLMQPHNPRLLKTYIEVTLRYPDLSQGEKDILFASQILFPGDSKPDPNQSTLND